MTKRQVLVLVGLTTVVVTCFGAASAGAAPTKTATPGANAVVLGNVRIDPNDSSVASVTARYTCPAGDAHLWVSVKQVADGRPDPALKEEGSSAISSAWLERHPGADEFTCDGTWHTDTYVIDAVTEFGFGALVPGQVYVQFCLTGPEIVPEQPTWFALDQRFDVAR
jgi:hypothetical protein